MAVKKFYSNKNKAGWKENPSYKPKDKLKRGENQKEAQKKYYSWGYDIDLEPIEYFEDGRPKRNRKREAGFASRDLAQAATARIKLGEKNSRYELEDRSTFPLLRDVFQKRLNSINQHQEKTRAKRVLNLILEILHDNGFGNIRINNLTTAMLQLYPLKRKELTPEIKDDTINRDFHTLRATLNQAKNFYPGLEKFVPPKIPFLKTPKTRRERVLQAEEVQLILNELMKDQSEKESIKKYQTRIRAGLLFALSAITGARPGELVALRETDILYNINALKITGTKTRFMTSKTVRYFPLVEMVKMILARALELKYKEYLFSQKGTLTKTYYSQVKRAVKAAGFDYGRKTAGGIIPYDLRHTATTLLVQSGADFETIKSITGQSRDTLWHYTHASRESIRRGAEVLQNFGENFIEKEQLGRGLDTETEIPVLNLALTTNK